MTQSPDPFKFHQYLIEIQQRVDAHLVSILQNIKCHEKLDEAISYALIGGGKRLRPFLAYAVADIYDVPHEEVDSIAAAIELIHCYSLVHDDLPDMDNSDLRRGKPSTWKKFEVPTAILVGDALLTLAFQIIAQQSCTGPSTRANLIAMLAQKAGCQGMVAGQMFDLFPEQLGDIDNILRMQQLKTGCLIAASCQAPSIIAGASSEEISFLEKFGYFFGLIFQITDDLLDKEGKSDLTGKPTGNDMRKNNVVNLLGEENTRELLEKLVSDALCLLDQLPQGGGMLRALIPWVLDRQN